MTARFKNFSEVEEVEETQDERKRGADSIRLRTFCEIESSSFRKLRKLGRISEKRGPWIWSEPETKQSQGKQLTKERSKEQIDEPKIYLLLANLKACGSELLVRGKRDRKVG